MASNGLQWFILAGCMILLTTDVTAIPVGDFYPFGSGAGDSLVDRTLDGSSPNITLPATFFFFGQSFSNIYVSWALNSLHCVLHMIEPSHVVFRLTTMAISLLGNLIVSFSPSSCLLTHLL